MTPRGETGNDFGVRPTAEGSAAFTPEYIAAISDESWRPEDRDLAWRLRWLRDYFRGERISEPDQSVSADLDRASFLIDRLGRAVHEMWSNRAVGDRRLTWREAVEQDAEELARLRPLATLLSDLDRCVHGRHSTDHCSTCGPGPSAGNPFAPAGTRIGIDLSGRPIVVPDWRGLTDPTAWKQP